MRVVLLANHWVGLEVCTFLRAKGDEISLLGIHEPAKQVYTKEIIRASGLPKSQIFMGNELGNPKLIARIRDTAPDYIVSSFWGYILKHEVHSIPKYGSINLHPAYLPFNRGVNPNVWPLIDGTPAGATIHYIDNGVDTGDIIRREKIPVSPWDTAETVYYKTLVELVSLFKDEWPRMRRLTSKRIPQLSTGDTPSLHKRSEIASLDTIDLDTKYTGREFIQKLRARSYSDRYYAHFDDNGTQVSVRVDMSPSFASRETKKKISPSDSKKYRNQVISVFDALKNSQKISVPATLLSLLPSGDLLELYPVSSQALLKKFDFSERGSILFFLRIAGEEHPFAHIGLHHFHPRAQSMEIYTHIPKNSPQRYKDMLPLAIKQIKIWAIENLPVKEFTI